jgi:two-component system, NarL family, nitrate/nitrite response regulator NarL
MSEISLHFVYMAIIIKHFPFTVSYFFFMIGGLSTTGGSNMERAESQLSIIIIDDHPLFRKGVSQLIALDKNFAIIAEASSGSEGLALVQSLMPDLVLLDMNMKGMSGIETLRTIKAFDSDILVVMLTVSDEQEDIVAALRAGADGYLLKDMEPEELRSRLINIAEGSLVVSPSLRKYLALAFNPENHTPSLTEAALTEREAQILQLIVTGRCNKLIGRELNITEGTVKVHVKHILKKLNLKSRLEAAVWVLEQQG